MLVLIGLLLSFLHLSNAVIIAYALYEMGALARRTKSWLSHIFSGQSCGGQDTISLSILKGGLPTTKWGWVFSLFILLKNLFQNLACSDVSIELELS